MADDLDLIDRLRIERVVWSLDQRLYDLAPHGPRRTPRRELRDNLRAAALDVGTSAAIRDVGDGGTLAAAFLEAELGRGPRPSWWAAGLFLIPPHVDQRTETPAPAALNLLSPSP